MVENAKKGKSKIRKSYYSKVEKPEGKSELEVAAEVEGIDDEIALLRSQIKKLWAENPDNLTQNTGLYLVIGNRYGF